MSADRIELLPASEDIPAPDPRPRMAEPLPVRLVAINHVRLPAPAGVEVRMDSFYEDIFRFQRADDRHQLIYHADNFDLRFDVLDRPVMHASIRPTGIEVPLLADIAQRLTEAEIEYTVQRGIFPGLESLLLLDPAGNWIEVTDARSVG
jgi:catechol-2,3-dioxygenase